MKKFISFSGGVESTAMCVLYGKGAVAIWCDTGAEHKEMYDRIDYCEKVLKEIHKVNFELVRLKASVKVKGTFVDSLIDAILGWKFMPSQGQRWCTGKFKIAPIDLFLKEQGACELYIGLNAD
jgi:3'-phosphoadenosine 5'-phosphosulfate sulfotransferase (PAPS reductase)/FAD synthetase